MSKRKIWVRPESSGWDDEQECVIPKRKGLRNKWPSPISCRLARIYPENIRMMREKRQNMTASDWYRKAEMHVRNLAFAQKESCGFHFNNRRYYRREQSYRLRQIRNCWNRYLMMKD